MKMNSICLLKNFFRIIIGQEGQAARIALSSNSRRVGNIKNDMELPEFSTILIV